MNKKVARFLAGVVLVGGLSGVLVGGSASAAPQCQPAGPAVICTDTVGGLEVIFYSDAVEIHTRVRYHSTHETGASVGDGFTQRASGAYLSCDATGHKYRLALTVIGSTKSRLLPLAC